MATTPLEAVRKWRDFATNFHVAIGDRVYSWGEYVDLGGRSDEERIIQPTAFPEFAASLLGWRLQLDLAPEVNSTEGRPDFTPADSVSHPFVFETKSTKLLHDFSTQENQVRRYLVEGGRRIQSVVVTNLVGISIYRLDDHGMLMTPVRIHLQGLLQGTLQTASTTGEATRLAAFIDDYSRKVLSTDQKVGMVRAADPWRPQGEATNSEWILARLDSIVKKITKSAYTQILSGRLTDPSETTLDERQEVLAEVRLLADRLGVDDSISTLDQFLQAGEHTTAGAALSQYAAHVAYYAATRLMLVRAWEDLGLLEPMLYDGGFDRQMVRFNDAISRVVEESFFVARGKYRSLFDHRNAYTWFTPDSDTYAEVIYELANTYLGAVESDILGQVYERMLERIDRKLLGVYYTPRDIISLIWDLLDIDTVSDVTTREWGREPRILDIATGSGGFLVEAASRLRDQFRKRSAQGAMLTPQEWLNGVADGLTGIEYNRFSAYLAELNLLVQFGQVLAIDPSLRLPQMGILSGDTLTLHNLDAPLADGQQIELPGDLIIDSEERRERARKIKAGGYADYLMDVACGNPPYIGEQSASSILAKLRDGYPYWEKFVAPHLDYLYWFLILGVSKLRKGGRFGFITTEYWLRAEGAAPMREYLAQRCHIEKILLFRDFRLFPDAPGQHSLIVIGTRVTVPDSEMTACDTPSPHKPKVSIYAGNVASPHPRDRKKILTAMRSGASRSGVETHSAAVSPNLLGRNSWADIMFTRSEIRQRTNLRHGDQVKISIVKGNETTVNRLTAKTSGMLPAQTLSNLGNRTGAIGIQMLTPAEVSGLGQLNEAERAHLHPVINTKDIYPYAVIVPDDANSIVFFDKPTIPPEWDADVVVGMPFPAGLPRLKAHLETFRPILESKTRSHGEKRPWWTLHRPRVVPVDAGDGFADFCVLSRWGSGGQMVVGRAPVGASPASGLHVVRSESEGVSAGYLTALYNSTVYQSVASSLPPGQLRKADLERIGLPLRQNFVTPIEEKANALAGIVSRFVKTHSEKFPRILEMLRQDVSLSRDCGDYWEPGSLNARVRAALKSTSWCSVAVHARSARPGRIEFSSDFLEPTLSVYANGTDRVAATITFPAGTDEKVFVAMCALIRAFACRSKMKVSDIENISVHIDGEDFAEMFEVDRVALLRDVDRYGELRQEIDRMFSDALN